MQNSIPALQVVDINPGTREAAFATIPAVVIHRTEKQEITHLSLLHGSSVRREGDSEDIRERGAIQT